MSKTILGLQINVILVLIVIGKTKPSAMRKLTFILSCCFLSFIASSQSHTINGKVTDNLGVPLAGATILEKKSNRGTQTRLDGSFALEARDSNLVLLVSHIGYETLEFAVGNQSELRISLQENVKSLGDLVVVIGYL